LGHPGRRGDPRHPRRDALRPARPRGAMTRNPIATAVLALVAGMVFVILYGPIFVPIVSSFFEVRQGAVQWDQATLGAYAALTRNEGILTALRNTLVVGAAAVLLSLALGTLL